MAAAALHLPPASNGRHFKAGRPKSTGTEPFDAAELCQRLESYRQEMKLEKLRREHKPSSKSTSGPYVPRYASRCHEPVIPRSEKPKADDHSIESTIWKRQESRHRLGWDADAAATANPEHLLMSRSRGLFEEKSSLEYPRRQELDQFDKQIQLHRRGSVRQTALADMTNIDCSKPGRPQRPLSTALENLHIGYGLDRRISPNENNPFLLALAENEAYEDSKDPKKLRNLNPSDRTDWAQASQAGSDVGNSLISNTFRKKDNDMYEVKSYAGLKPTKSHQYRTASHGEAPMNLISEAVRLVKEDEKKRRRSSILGLFKRH